MRDVGCAFGCLIAIVLPAVLLIIYRVRADSAAVAKKAAAESAAMSAAQDVRRARGIKITELLQSLSHSADQTAIAREVYGLLRNEPVGFLPELSQSKGLFEQAAPILHSLALGKGSAPEVVALYFQCFSFPSGQQSAVLSWLHDLLNETVDPAREQLFKRVTDSVLMLSDLAEADWLYRRVLDRVRETSGLPPFKAIALHVGRLRYAAARPDRRPTIYDEQAIANDITMSIQ
jgi:hypothetical protein